MSTKIYNGIKFKTQNLKELLSQLQDLKPKAVEVGIENLKKEMVSFILYNKLTEEDYYTILSKLKDSLSKPMRTIMEPSFKFSVIVFPHSSGDLYGYFLDDNLNGYHKLLFDNDIAEDYHYQNQTDRPENLTEIEWAARKEMWDELLPGDGHLGNNGFMYKIVSEDDCGFGSGLAKYIKEEGKPNAIKHAEEREILNDFIKKFKIDNLELRKVKNEDDNDKSVTYKFCSRFKRLDVNVAKDDIFSANKVKGGLDALVKKYKKPIEKEIEARDVKK